MAEAEPLTDWHPPKTRHIDAILQNGMTFDARLAAEKWPSVIYTDTSVVLTRSLGRAWRLDLTEARIEPRVAQERMAMDSAAMVCTWSAFVAAALCTQQGIATSKIAVVGAGPNIVARGPRTKPPRQPFSGREFLRKGGDLVLAAFARLRQEFNRIEIDFERRSPPENWALASTGTP